MAWDFKKNNGFQPVADDVIVNVVCRNGVELTRKAADLQWSLDFIWSGITKWRLYSEKQVNESPVNHSAIDNALINHGNQVDIENNDVPNISKNHPLLNPDSPHYKILGDESIEQFEKMFTVEELRAWAKLTYYKYMFRLGKKDDIEKERAKMKTYEDYYHYLGSKL